MRTDSIFYQFFQLFPDLLGELLKESSTANYRFTSIEIKELSRRIDGVFVPQSDDVEQRLYFVEVQFQPDDRIYERLITEAYLYLGQYRPDYRWRCVAIWAKSSLDGGIPLYYQEMVEIGLLKVVYLDQLPEGESLGLSLLRLVLIEEEQISVELSLLERQLDAISNASLEREIVELIEKVLIYKFPRLSSEELAAMFGQQELEQTRFYQDVLQRGRKEGRVEGREEGLVEGREEGFIEGKLDAIPNLLSLNLTAERIAEILQLDLARVQNEIAKLHQQN